MSVNRELLHNTLSIQSKSGQTKRMQKYLLRFAKKHGIQATVDQGNIYMVKGEANLYPCAVAHTDTVHKIIDNFAVVIHKGVYYGKDRDTGKQHGVGGDDKVGVALALQALIDFPVMKAAFFRDEEIGCVGSRQADMSFFKDVSLVAQADRRGNHDFADTIFGNDLVGRQFAYAVKPLLEQHGYKSVRGMLTDVYQLRENGLECPSFNMSAGYHDPHSDRETVNIEDVDAAWGLMSSIIDELGGEKWDHPYFPESEFALWWEDEENEADMDDEEGDFIDLDGFGSKERLSSRVGRDSEQGELRSIVQMHTHINGTDECPLCGSVSLLYDDTLGAFYCSTCLDFVGVPNIDDDDAELLGSLVNGRGEPLLPQQQMKLMLPMRVRS